MKETKVPGRNLTHRDLKQEGHDGPEVAHLYKGTRSGASLNPRAFIYKLGRHPLEDVSRC
jgi:hypothetical protein